MHYLITTEEIIMLCSEKVRKDRNYIETLGQGCGGKMMNMQKYVEKLYEKMVIKIRNDPRLTECQEGYFICIKKDKDALENEYGFRLIQVHPDDFVV